MGRQVRIEYAGATYHVMARGNHAQAIYDDDQDRQLWLETLGEACEKTGWRVHADVMMGNHDHLLCERLGMGEVSAVTRAIRVVKNGRDLDVERLENRLLKRSKSP